MGPMMNLTSLMWRKGTSSEAGSCVEVACFEHAVLVRDSKDRGDVALVLSRSDWQWFLEHLKSGAPDSA